MSRIGKKPIDIPEGVKVQKVDKRVDVEGPLGKLSQQIVGDIDVEINLAQKKIFVRCNSDHKRDRALWGLTRTLIANMIEGVTKGYEKILEISGVGYNAKIQGKQIVMQLGFSHPVIVDIPEGLTVSCPNPVTISIKGIDKQAVGNFAAFVRSKKVVEPYNLKGIKYRGEVVKRKAGKTFVSGA
jgi:large subunit ribosomal protein L6